MNIAVVTVYDGLNFGSFLQAFAMKHYLEERGHQVVFVQRLTEEENLALYTTNRPEEDCGKIKKVWRKFRKYVIHRKKIERENQFYTRQFPKYQEAWQCFNRYTPERLDNIDCIICGSDEIWNLNNVNLDIPFYTCAGYGENAAKLAVAVSAGNSTREQFRMEPEAEEAIRDFTEIIVRDRQSKEIVEDIIDREVEVVCDPTLLVDREIFRSSGSGIRIDGPYMLVYTYGLTGNQSRILSEFARKNNYRVVSACMDLDISDQTVYAAPMDFAELIEGAECCFTTTFHGTIFSLLFARRFCTVASFPKIEDLIMVTGESGHLWNSEEKEELERIMKLQVDRQALDRRLEILKERSVRIVDKALMNIENMNYLC